MKLLYDENAKGCRQESIETTLIKLGDGGLEAQLPSFMEPMPKELAEMYYPYENRPDAILSDQAGVHHVTFQVLDKKLEPGTVGTAAEAVSALMERLYPQSQIFPVHLYKKGSIPIGWFSMELEEDGEPMTHVKAVLSHKEKLCLLTATYPQRDELKWDAVLRNVYDTLQEQTF